MPATSKGRLKLKSATSCPNRMLKQIGHMVGTSQNRFSLLAMMVKPPVLPANFDVYDDP